MAQQQMSFAALLLWQKSGQMYVKHVGITGIYFYLTASYGGTLDYLIPKNPDVFQRVAYVVYTEAEAAAQGLEIDHDDSHCLGDKPFALLVHGSQRAGTPASTAVSQRKKDGGFVGYGKTFKKESEVSCTIK